MAQIIESIPNISEGRNKDVIEACVDQIRTTPGCTLLDYSSDESHNRSVITYIGDAPSVEEASVKLVKKAAELIDLTKHKGEHPRMGAVDVMPLLPIKDCTTDDCVELSKWIGKRIAEEVGVPIFLYEYSAQRPERKNLVTIRKGQFEGMAAKVQEPDWEPDFGGRRIHPTAGVTAVGLDSVKAMGFEIEDEATGKKYAQVSCNLTNFEIAPIYRVCEMVKMEAKRYGATVTETELIGLCPMKALIDSAEYYLQIKDFDFDKQVLENHII